MLAPKKVLEITVAFMLVSIIAVLDIAVVEFILNAAGITDQYVRIWHVALFGVFIPVLFVVFWFLLGQRIIALWTVGLIAGGWEDAIYFWLQSRAVPAELPWHPYLQTAGAVYAGMALSFVVLLLITRGLE